MVNRVMQQKTLKLKRQRRLFPRKFLAEVVHVSSQSLNEVILRDFVKEGSAHVTSGSSSKFRLRTTSQKEADELARRAYLEAMFPSWFGIPNNQPRALAMKKSIDIVKKRISPGEEARRLSQILDTGKPAKETVEKLCEMLKGIPLENNVIVLRTDTLKIMLFFSTSRTLYYFVRIDILRQTVQSSINYGSRSRAMDVFKRKCIQYKKPVPLHPDSPS